MRQIKMYSGCLLYLFLTNSSFATSIPTAITDIRGGDFNSQMPSLLSKEPNNNTLGGGNSSESAISGDISEAFTRAVADIIDVTNKNHDVLKNLAEFKTNRKFFFNHKLFYGLKKEDVKRVDDAIERFCETYREDITNGNNFIGLEKDGVFVGKVHTKDKKIFLGRCEGSSMFGLYSSPQENQFSIGYFNMNDEGNVKHAGIFSGPFGDKCFLSIKTGPERQECTRLYIDTSATIEGAYKAVEQAGIFQKVKTSDVLTTQVVSMFKELKEMDLSSEKISYFSKLIPVGEGNILTQSDLSLIKDKEILKEFKKERGAEEFTVYSDVFSFPIYLEGEKRTGLLCFVAEEDGSFSLCFGLQTSEKGMCEFVPLLIISFLEKRYVVGQSYLLFDYKNYSNSCRINYSKVDSSFCCNLSLPKDKEIIIANKLGEGAVSIASPLKSNKVNSLQALIQTSESRFGTKEENNDFFLYLNSKETISLEFPCSSKKTSINFCFLFHNVYSCFLNDSIAKGDDVISILGNFFIVLVDRVLLFDCSNTDILNVKMFLNGVKELEANFYYPKEERNKDTIFAFVKKFTEAVFSYVPGSELPFIMSFECFKKADDCCKDVDNNESGNFLNDVFTNAKEKNNSIKEDVKDLDNKDLSQEKEEEKIEDDTSMQDTVINKIITNTNESKNHKKKRRKKKKNKDNNSDNKMSSIESTINISDSSTKGLIQGDGDFKPGDVVFVEYSVQGCKGTRNIKHIIEDEEKKFFGEKRRIVILSKEKKMPLKFTYKGSVSEILESGEKVFPKAYKLLSMALFNLSCAKILKSSSIKLSKIKNLKIGNRDVFEVYISQGILTEIGKQVRLIVTYDKSQKTFYVFDSLCHYDK